MTLSRQDYSKKFQSVFQGKKNHGAAGRAKFFTVYPERGPRINNTEKKLQELDREIMEVDEMIMKGERVDNFTRARQADKILAFNTLLQEYRHRLNKKYQ